jgi:Spy/CpxP family protein refolding chaperone
MSGNRIVKQMAIAAGLLVMGLAPGLGRAQSSAPASPTYQDQNQAAPQQQGRKHGGEMANLNLTDDQKAQMKQIHESSKSQMDAVNNDSSLTADQKQAKMKQIHRGAHMQMVKLLTPEQRQQMKADAKARHAARQQGQSEQSQPPSQPQSQQ